MDLPAEEPLLLELKKAIDKLENNKAPGKDNIPTKCWKYKAMFHPIITIWREKYIPAEWSESIRVLLLEKDSRTKHNNDKNINSDYKVLSNILLVQRTPFAESFIGDYQCGRPKFRFSPLEN